MSALLAGEAEDDKETQEALKLQYRSGLPYEVELPHWALSMPLLVPLLQGLGLVASLLPASPPDIRTCRLLTEVDFLKIIFVLLEVTPYAVR